MAVSIVRSFKSAADTGPKCETRCAHLDYTRT
jgi:hypothetical protein